MKAKMITAIVLAIGCVSLAVHQVTSDSPIRLKQIQTDQTQQFIKDGYKVAPWHMHAVGEQQAIEYAAQFINDGQGGRIMIVGPIPKPRLYASPAARKNNGTLPCPPFCGDDVKVAGRNHWDCPWCPKDPMVAVQ
jgi:hypothetical protein